MIDAVATQKGGTGKTTTSIALAAGLARKGKKILLVDIDSQANSSKVLLPNYPEIPGVETVFRTIIGIPQHGEVEKRLFPLPIYPTALPNLEIAPSHILLAETDMELTIALDRREARLKNALDGVKGQYDYVFLDCPPSLGWLTMNAFTAAEKVIVVVEPGYFELDSIAQLQRTLTTHSTFCASKINRKLSIVSSLPSNAP